MLKAIKITVLILVLATLSFAVWGGLTLRNWSNKPGASLDRPEIFAIPSGEAFDLMAARLEDRGIITSPFRFKLLARLKGVDKNLKAGEYNLTAAMTPNQVLDVLVNGKTFLYRLTIPEGYTARQIAGEIAAQDLGSAEEFMALVTDPAIARQFGFAAGGLEGYLFPDTYFFPKGVAAQTIVEKMVARFKEQFQPEWIDRARELHFTPHQIVTLASIIEKETGRAEERPLISSVFHNRLKKKMRLESDPTVIYGIKDFDGNIKRSHLTTPTPYNTYIIKGLPPGPIANPGKAAIEAALYPAKSDYLFFVSRKDSSHQFSVTIEEHNRAVRKYQLRRQRPKPGA